MKASLLSIPHTLKLYTLGLLMLSVTAHQINGDPEWNYDKHGADWNFTNCNSSSMVQSPVNTTFSAKPFDWYGAAFTFLPSYEVSGVTEAGPKDYVYRLYGDFGGVFASETLPIASSTRQVRWDANEIRFHYPSEHIVNNKTYDLEMQIFHKVPLYYLYNFIGYLQ